MLEQNTPDVTLEQNTPDVTLEENTPDVVLEQNTPDITLEPSPPDVPGAAELRTESATSVTSCEEQIEGATRRPYTIVIEGNIGAGKTSFLELIRASSPETVDILTEPVEQWQNCQGNNLLQLMYEDPQKNSFAFQTYALLTKVQMHEMPTTKPFHLMERSVLSARYCFIENLHNNNTITESEYAVLDEWFKHLATSPLFNFKVDQIVYLRTDPKVSFERIAKRGRPEESGVTLEYIEQLHQLHEDWLFNQTKFQPLPAPVKIIDVTSDLSTLSEKLTLQELLCLENIGEESRLQMFEQTATAVKSAPHLTKEEVEQNPNSCEKYSTYWDRVLHEAVKDMWEQDKILREELSPGFSNQNKETDKSRWTETQIASDNKMEIIYLPERGRFQASIPWKSKPRFRNNLTAIQARQRGCVRKLEETDLEEIRKIFQSYENKGYIRRVLPSEVLDPDANYLPWFPVFRRDRDTTKIRLVFDAAAKDTRGVSLNSEIELGPNRLQDLFKLIMRIRKYQFVVLSDISEMFLQILLNPKDRKYHRFVFEDAIYEWLVILFGNLSSPNASQKVLELCCQLFGEKFPEAVISILNSCYMDDVCDSRETEEQATQLVCQLIDLLKHAGMVVTKFYSNSKKALEACDKSLLAKSVKFEDKNIVYEQNKVLGMIYSADESDCLQFAGKFNSVNEWKTGKGITTVKKWTKRVILQGTATIYDPAGLISPYTVQSKTIMQDIWRTKIDWDDAVSKETIEKFCNWVSGVFDLDDLKIPRWTGYTSNCTRLEIHVFCDASEAGYCAAVYSRVIHAEKATMTLLAARCRVSPLKSESISRMELIACVLGVRMWNGVKNTYDALPEHVHFWTDSMVCLYWLSEPAKAFKAFVSHRVGEIQRMTKTQQWHHIPTDQNPADVGTRPITAKELRSRTLWWKGPEFLRTTTMEWPETKIVRSEDPKEEKSTTICSVTLKSLENIELSREAFERCHPRHFSVSKRVTGYIKCIRVRAYVLRAVRIFKGGERPSKNQPQLTQVEFEEARKWLIKEAQQEFYCEELAAMTKEKANLLCKTSAARKSEIRKFNPGFDEDGILRSNSRLTNIDFYPYDRKYPIILPRKAEFTRLLLEHFHVRFEHPIGYKSLKSEVQAMYAIHGLSTLVAQVRSRCEECRRNKRSLATQQMAPLPKIRLSEEVRPFYKVGLDFAGPFHIKVGRAKARTTVSVLVITCLQVRAVHFEVTEGQQTKHVLNALSRFADLRGVPDTIISDNQTSFHKADKDLREWIQNIDFDELIEKTGIDFKPNSKAINWIFNPPVSPHFGGIYETIVKAMKRALYATIKHADLDEDEFRTAVSGAMGILNSRPISPSGESEFDALTPDHFLKTHLKGAVFPPNTDTSMNFRERYRHVDVILNHLWSRFHKEIPGGLVPRRKWSEEKPNLEIGDLVAELDHTIPRKKWRLLRVVETYPGADDLIRRVLVANSEGKTYERGVARLLPVASN